MWPKPYPSSETIYVALCRWLKSKHKIKHKDQRSKTKTPTKSSKAGSPQDVWLGA
jgi:hypothetical protein